jgi:hypothetical protein
VLCELANEGAALARIGERSAGYGTQLETSGEAVRIVL